MGETIYQEIEAARNGSEPALAAIIAKRMDLIRLMARKATYPGLEFDDAVQEGLIGLFRAIETYQSDSDASFSTYSAVCIRNAIASARKTAGRMKHAPLNQSVPLSENHSTPGPEDQAILKEQVSITLGKMRSSLSSLEKSVLHFSLAGFTRKDIARKLGITVKSVENALLRARKKLR